MSVNETVYFKLTLASPVHVGCGEVYEPMSFVIDEEDLELISFDTADFMSLLTDNELEKLSAICMKGTVASLQELYKFMNKHSHVARGVRIAVSKVMAGHYGEVLEKDQRRFCRELNQFEINRTYFNPVENFPVIPGSAIKGAIRTAVLNDRNRGQTRPGFRGRTGSKDMEEHLLQYSFRDMGSDPFRLVKVSDFVPAGKVKRRICYAVDIKKKPSEREASAPYQMQEVIEAGCTFWGSITVTSAPHSIRRPVTMQEIMAALKKFYGSEKKREDRELKSISVTPVSMEGAVVPLRIGRHSGAECVTVKGHRHIKIMQGRGNKPRYKDHATTIWLAADTPRPKTMQGLKPMGWITVHRLSEKEVQRLKKQRDEARAEQLKCLEKEMDAAARAEQERLQRQQAEEKARRKQEQAEAEAKARLAALEEQWESMSELEQDLAIIRGDEIAGLQAPGKEPLKDIWPKVLAPETEYKKELAVAFREIWEQNPKQWQKKKCSKKQWQKVQLVKSILEEG